MMGFAAAQTHPTGCKSACQASDSVSAAITCNSRHLSGTQMDQSAFPAASRLRPTGGGLRRSLSSARVQICSTHSPRIAGVALDPTQVAALTCGQCFGGADMGIIMVRFVRLRFAAVAMIAAAITSCDDRLRVGI